MPQTKKPTKRNIKNTSQSQNQGQEVDSVFFFKLLLYLILGSMWFKISGHNSLNIPLPVGLLVGLFFTTHEHFQIDKKIEYAVLLVAMLVGFFVPYGFYINF